MTLDVDPKFVQSNAKRSCGGFSFCQDTSKLPIVSTWTWSLSQLCLVETTIPSVHAQIPTTLQFQFMIEISIHDSPHTLKINMWGFHLGSMFGLRQMCVRNSLNSMLVRTLWAKHAFFHIPRITWLSHGHEFIHPIVFLLLK